MVTVFSLLMFVLSGLLWLARREERIRIQGLHNRMLEFKQAREAEKLVRPVRRMNPVIYPMQSTTRRLQR